MGQDEHNTKGSDANENKDAEEPTLEIAIYGGNEQQIRNSLAKHESSEFHIYQTWVNIKALRKLGFLFEGGVESAGGIFEIVIMFLVITLAVVMFVFYHLVIFFIVFAVLAILSGGVALKYLRGTFIQGDESKVDINGLVPFVREQIQAGNFIEIKTQTRDIDDRVIQRTNRDTMLFKHGIHIALIVSTVLFVVEVLYRLFFAEWLTNIEVLILFGLVFLGGVLIMNSGAYLRRRFENTLQ